MFSCIPVENYRLSGNFLLWIWDQFQVLRVNRFLQHTPSHCHAKNNMKPFFNFMNSLCDLACVCVCARWRSALKRLSTICQRSCSRPIKHRCSLSPIREQHLCCVYPSGNSQSLSVFHEPHANPPAPIFQTVAVQLNVLIDAELQRPPSPTSYSTPKSPDPTSFSY